MSPGFAGFCWEGSFKTCFPAKAEPFLARIVVAFFGGFWDSGVEGFFGGLGFSGCVGFRVQM